MVSRSVARPRFTASLLGLFAVIGLVLGGLVWLAGQVSDDTSGDAEAQTADILRQLDALLTEEEKERLLRELQEAVAARDEFLSIASHELKTPITTIKGFVDILQRRALREERGGPAEGRGEGDDGGVEREEGGRGGGHQVSSLLAF